MSLNIVLHDAWLLFTVAPVVLALVIVAGVIAVRETRRNGGQS